MTLVQNIKRFLFEFIIVTLGILTAFNINKWDENNKLKSEEKEAYEAIKKDLNSDLYVLNYYKDAHLIGKNYLKPILENNYDRIDSLSYYIQVAYNLQEGNATYVNLKYSGKLGILKNQELKRRILLYYETYYQGLDNLAESHKEMVYNNIQPYLFKNLKYDASPAQIAENLKQDEFLNLINYQMLTLEGNILIFDKCEALMKTIIELIDEELEVKE